MSEAEDYRGEQEGQYKGIYYEIMADSEPKYAPFLVVVFYDEDNQMNESPYLYTLCQAHDYAEAAILTHLDIGHWDDIFNACE